MRSHDKRTSMQTHNHANLLHNSVIVCDATMRDIKQTMWNAHQQSIMHEQGEHDICWTHEQTISELRHMHKSTHTHSFQSLQLVYQTKDNINSDCCVGVKHGDIWTAKQKQHIHACSIHSTSQHMICIMGPAHTTQHLEHAGDTAVKSTTHLHNANYGVSSTGWNMHRHTIASTHMQHTWMHANHISSHYIAKQTLAPHNNYTQSHEMCKCTHCIIRIQHRMSKWLYIRCNTMTAYTELYTYTCICDFIHANMQTNSQTCIVAGRHTHIQTVIQTERHINT